MGVPHHLTCLLRNLYAGQEATELNTEQKTGSKLEKEYIKAIYCYPAYLNYTYIIRNAGLDDSQTGIKNAGRNITNPQYADDAL